MPVGGCEHPGDGRGGQGRGGLQPQGILLYLPRAVRFSNTIEYGCMDGLIEYGCTLTIVVGPPDLNLPPQHQRTRQEEVVVDRLKGHSKKVGRYR